MTYEDAVNLSTGQALEIKEQAVRGDEVATRAFVCYAFARRVASLKISRKKKMDFYNLLMQDIKIKVKYVG